MATRAAKNMDLLSKLANRVLRNAEKEDREDKERAMTRSIQDDLLRVTSSIANIRQMQRSGSSRKESERNVQINTNERKAIKDSSRDGDSKRLASQESTTRCDLHGISQ